MSVSDKLCSLCNGGAKFLFTQRVLKKHDVRYFRCSVCDLIQTEKPYWLDEAYAETISMIDTGAIARNLECRNLTLSICSLIGVNQSSQCLDYGGGHGVFVRMMRDNGFDFRWHDRYGKNIFAKGFERDPGTTYDLVTLFEVFEHLDNVHDELDKIFRPQHKFILVGTTLHSGNGPDWWYYMPQGGQHVSFFSKITMEYIRKIYGYNVVCGSLCTLFINKKFKPYNLRDFVAKKLLSGSNLVFWVNMFSRKFEPLTWKDHLYLSNAK